MAGQHPLQVLAWFCLVATIVSLSITDDGEAAPWTKQAQAQGNQRWREQVVLFADQVRDGERLDRADPWLPPLDAEAEEARRLNFDRCRVAVDQMKASGQVRRLAFDDPRTLFTVSIDGQRWREDRDITVPEDIACVFTAGDVRRGIRFTVFDERGRLIGQWWGRRLIGERHGE